MLIFQLLFKCLIQTKYAKVADFILYKIKLIPSKQITQTDKTMFKILLLKIATSEQFFPKKSGYKRLPTSELTYYFRLKINVRLKLKIKPKLTSYVKSL